VEIPRLDDFVYYKEIQINLEKNISENLYINLLIFFLFCVIWVSLLGFATPLLFISGILFGKWLGTAISVLSISVGALILYLIASFFFKDLVRNLLEKKYLKYINLFRKNEFNYLLAFRLAGGLGVPFGPQNVLPVIFNIKKMNYFIASFLGFIPTFFISNTIGSGLNEYVKSADNFSFLNLILNKEIYLPIILFVFVISISLIIKKKIFDVRN
tara:strand:- start:61 stop:702 length:642 start_codon:yes stop_codon:yes gene_type:complete